MKHNCRPTNLSKPRRRCLKSIIKSSLYALCIYLSKLLLQVRSIRLNLNSGRKIKFPCFKEGRDFIFMLKLSHLVFSYRVIYCLHRPQFPVFSVSVVLLFFTVCVYSSLLSEPRAFIYTTYTVYPCPSVCCSLFSPKTLHTMQSQEPSAFTYHLLAFICPPNASALNLISLRFLLLVSFNLFLSGVSSPKSCMHFLCLFELYIHTMDTGIRCCAISII